MDGANSKLCARRLMGPGARPTSAAHRLRSTMLPGLVLEFPAATFRVRVMWVDC
jgi:hypothetical protein